MQSFRQQMDVAEGAEWEPLEGVGDQAGPAGLSGRRSVLCARHPPLSRAIDSRAGYRRAARPRDFHTGRLRQDPAQMSLSDAALADRIVTTSPDVTVSTNLGGWVNQRGLFARSEMADTFRDERVPSAQK